MILRKIKKMNVIPCNNYNFKIEALLPTKCNDFFEGGVRVTLLFHFFLFVASLSNFQGYVREVRPGGSTPLPVRGLHCLAYSCKTTLACSYFAWSFLNGELFGNNMPTLKFKIVHSINYSLRIILRWLENVLVFSMHYIWELKYVG